MKNLILGAIVLSISLLPKESLAENYKKWDNNAWLLESAYLVTNTVDWSQTRRIGDMGLEEQNPILGKYPSNDSIDLWFVGLLILHPVVSHYLPKRWRKAWQYSTIAISSACVVNNYNHGLGINVRF